MPRSKSPKTLTLFLFIGLALAMTAEASGHSPAMRRDHTGLKRMIKKRAPQTGSEENTPSTPPLGAGGLGPVKGAGKDDTGLESSSTVSSSTTLSSSSTSSSSSSTSSSSSSVSSSSSSSSSQASSTSSSSSVPASSSTGALGSITVPTPTPTPLPNQTGGAVNTVAQQQSTVTQTQTANESESTEPPKTTTGALSGTGKTIMTVLVVLAVSVGACILLWTVVRRWTQKKDRRLDPIDWQPTNADDDIIPANRRLSGASFRSASGYAATDAASSHHGHGGLNPIPDHDFTAGSTLAPVGGYANLHRGPSPGPQMSEGIHRGPSMTRPNFEAGVPLHHQTGYTSQDAYKY